MDKDKTVRVISGSARSIVLRSPEIARPMTSRAKATLFDVIGSDIVGKRILDLYAGSGSLGIEALSRGAASCTFVDTDHPAIVAIKQNLAKTGFLDKAQIEKVKALTFLDEQPGNSFDIVFADPPYDFYKSSRQRVLALLEQIRDVIPDGGAIALKHPTSLKMPEIKTLILADRREFGPNSISLFVRPASL